MATWTRSFSADLVGSTDTRLSGPADLDTDTSPADFDETAVNSVRFQFTLSHLGTFNSGSGSDSYSLDASGDTVEIETSGGTQLATVSPTGTIQNGTATVVVDLTDNSPNNTASVADWEGAQFNGVTSSQITDFNQGKGKDGVTPQILASSVTITIDYTPANLEITPGLSDFTATAFNPEVQPQEVTVVPGLSDFTASAFNPTVVPMVDTDIAKLGLSNPTEGDPTVDTAHTVRVRARSTTATSTRELNVSLYQGASTEIESWTITLTTSFVTDVQALSSANVANITDYDDLRLWFTGVGSSGAVFEVSWAELGYPEGVAAGDQTIVPGLSSATATAFDPTVINTQVIGAPALVDQTATAFDPTVLAFQTIGPPALVDQTATSFNPVVLAFQTIGPPALVDRTATAFDPAVQNTQIIGAPTLVDQTASAFDPEVQPQEVTISPDLVDQTAVAFNPAVLAFQTIGAPALVDQTASAFDPEVQAQPVTIEPALVDSSAAAFDPQVVPQEVTIFPALVDSSAAAFDPEVVALEVTIVPDLVDSTAVAFNPTVLAIQTVGPPALVDQTASAFAPTVVNTQVVSPGLVDSSASAFDPAVEPRWEIIPALVSSVASAFNPEVQPQEVTIQPGLVTSTATAFNPTVIQSGALQTITPGLTSSTATALAPTVNNTQIIAPALTSTTATAFNPAVLAFQTIGAPALVDQTAVAFNPTVLAFQTVGPPGLVDNTATAFDPVVANVSGDLQTITPTLVTTAATAFDPTIVNTQVVQPGLVDSSASAFNPVITLGGTTIAKLSLSNPLFGAPSVDTDHRIRIRQQSSSGTGQRDLRVSIYQGASTLIHTNLIQNIDPGWSDSSWPLLEAEATNITDYNDLFVWFEGIGATASEFEISWFELQYPRGTDLGISPDLVSSPATALNPVVGSVPLTDTARIGLSDVVDPNTDDGHIARIRARKVNAGDAGSLLFQVWDTTAGQFLFTSSAPLTTSFQTFEVPIDPSGAALIQDYSTLEFRFWGRATDITDTLDVEVSWAELQVPEVGALTILPGLVSSPATAFNPALGGAAEFTLRPDLVFIEWYDDTYTDTYMAGARAFNPTEIVRQNQLTIEAPVVATAATAFDPVVGTTKPLTPQLVISLASAFNPVLDIEGDPTHTGGAVEAGVGTPAVVVTSGNPSKARRVTTGPAHVHVLSKPPDSEPQ